MARFKMFGHRLIVMLAATAAFGAAYTAGDAAYALGGLLGVR